jgi:hypothetical protein
MKRFFCTACKQVKRVRNLPLEIVTPNAEMPTNRVGVCDWHRTGVINGRAVSSTPKPVNYKKLKSSNQSQQKKKAS